MPITVCQRNQTSLCVYYTVYTPCTTHSVRCTKYNTTDYTTQCHVQNRTSSLTTAINSSLRTSSDRVLEDSRSDSDTRPN